MLIRVENLVKAFGDNTVLNGITMEIHKGEVISVIGPSGCGKSTFIRSLNLLEEPTGGRILFDGEDITERGTDQRRVRERIGMVFQQFNLFQNMTVKKNIMLAPVHLKLMTKAEAEKKLWSCCSGWGWPTKRICILPSFPADKNSGWLSPVRWR